MRLFATLVCIACMAGPGCGGGSTDAETKTAKNHTKDNHKKPLIPETPVSEHAIDREVLIQVLDGGLGRFLSGVQTRPFFVHGKFAGFELMSLFPQDKRFKTLAPKAGDVVVRINGKKIERPEQALEVWESLRVASELRIAFLRDNQVQEVRYPIVDSMNAL